MIARNDYLQKLIDRMNNGMIKVVTGIRRCGKSYLLFDIFYNYLLQNGVDKEHIISLQLDDRMNIRYRDPDFLCEYVHSKIVDEKNYFIFLDEVQYVNEFEEVLISFLHIKNADVYLDDYMYVEDLDVEIDGKIADEKLLKNQNLMDQIKVISVYKGKAVPSIIFDSLGTRKFAALASYVIEAIEQGKTLIIDDLDSSLHFKE